MIRCAKCQTENDDEARFCKKCGNDLTVNKEAPSKDELNELAEELNRKTSEAEIDKAKKTFGYRVKNSIFFRKKKNIIITSVVCLLLVALVSAGLNSGYIAFCAAYNSGKYDLAQKIQHWSFNSDSANENIEEFVISKADDYYTDFLNEKIGYEDANKMFEIIGRFTNNSNAKYKTGLLNDSRESFKKGEEKEKSGEIFEAVLEYMNVISDDPNYKTAQKKINDNKSKLKSDTIDEMKKCVSVNDFNTGLKIVEKMKKIFPNDSDFNSYKSDFESRKKAYKTEQDKNNQTIKVLSARAYNDGYYTIFRKATVVVQNCGNKVMKECTVGILLFDDNGYPVDADDYNSDGENCFYGRASSANLKPGETYGENRYWSIADNATRVKACVKTAEFIDGTKWTNPYYSVWLEKEKDRY
mgnify:CR=1 FL=1